MTSTTKASLAVVTLIASLGEAFAIDIDVSQSGPPRTADGRSTRPT